MSTSTRVTQFWREWRFFFAVVLLLVLFRTAIADWYVVPTGSMKPTILEGDRIFVNKLAYNIRVPFTEIELSSWDAPEYGDIVVFLSPKDETRLIKRVVGLPGDQITIKQNHLLINDQPVPFEKSALKLEENIWSAGIRRELYNEQIGSHQYDIALSPFKSPLNDFGPVTVPENHFFMLGDNRDNSADSRIIGFVERSRILGRASHVIVSLNYGNYYLPRKDRTLVELP